MSNVKTMGKSLAETELPGVENAEHYIQNTVLELASTLKEDNVLSAKSENTLDSTFDNIPRPSPRM